MVRLTAPAALKNMRTAASSMSNLLRLSQDPTPKGGGLQYQVSFPENALSGTDCNRLLDGSPILLRTENYATTKRNEIQACSDVVGTCAFLPTPKSGGFSPFFPVSLDHVRLGFFPSLELCAASLASRHSHAMMLRTTGDVKTLCRNNGRPLQFGQRCQYAAASPHLLQ